MDLVPCGGCRRHVRATDASCPFCAATIEPSKAARLARAAFTAGIAATCSVTLAACYGGPPVYGVDHGPPRWKVQAAPDAYLSEVESRATAAGCEVSGRGTSAKVVTCRSPDAQLGFAPGSDGVYITCEEGSPADCVATFDRIRATEAAPSSSVPAIAPIEPPDGGAP